MGKYSLKEFFINEDESDANDESMYNPTINEIGTYKATLGDQQFNVTFDVNRNETKKGIKIKFFPLENGRERELISKEELDKISNDLAVQLSPKFVILFTWKKIINTTHLKLLLSMTQIFHDQLSLKCSKLKILTWLVKLLLQPQLYRSLKIKSLMLS